MQVTQPETAENTAALVRDARRAYQDGDMAAAVDLARQVLAVEPQEGGMLDLMGIVAFGQHDAATATTLLKRAVSLEPRNPDYHTHLGQVLRAQGEMNGALDEFSKALQVKPEFATLMDVLAGQGSMNEVQLRVAQEFLKLFTTFQPNSIHDVFQIPRILQYSLLSNCSRLTYGTGVTLFQPWQTMGDGAINIGNNVRIGWIRSPFLYSGACYLDARTADSVINVGDRTLLNNNFVGISEGAGIHIGNDVLIGVNVSIHDANFHHLDPALRHVANDPEPASVRIEDNVWIGDNVKVLKGVTIGANSVIGNGSIVSRSVPAGVVAAGVPARVIRNI